MATANAVLDQLARRERRDAEGRRGTETHQR
jgi:hypothetical protein